MNENRMPRNSAGSASRPQGRGSPQAAGGKEFTVQIKDERCKGCAICVEICPKKVLAMSKEPMASGYLLAQVIDQPKCIGCMECELHCPDLAIEVTAKKDEAISPRK